MGRLELNGKTIFVTGVAGFIGSNLAKKLCQDISDVKVIGIDNMNDYYDVRIKEMRRQQLEEYGTFTFFKGDIADRELIWSLFTEYKPQIVVNLAAQAGVRYSITNPDTYIESNILGFYNILEACRQSYKTEEGGVEHLVYASSSSIYGNIKKFPTIRRTRRTIL